ncbi:hypothetical protein Tsubulata_048056 [Turnera subulata]|uniref:CCHC-type domain-containing protein n=1 Tax=Turnera subulata TaxID=218843 RepID=A0A9Q0JMV2_9ROSI|nr:hypothetical protein Tsubulata_048056 [Turnera subulata]
MPSSVCASFRILPVPPWQRHGIKSSFQILVRPKRKTKNFISRVICCSNNSNHKKKNESTVAIQTQAGTISSLLFFDDVSGNRKPKSWFGPNGQYIRELPCPSCRGRGYIPCAECGIERSRLDCALCGGKGITTCSQCSGDCVIWEESIDERPWEEARSISPLKVKEDDEVDNLEIKLNMKERSKRVYQSPSPEVRLKISRSLKILNAKTGLFSKRMKIIHRDPKLRAQRLAAIKKARGTPAARKHTSESLKAFFSDPENRRKRSISMKGIDFFCSNCGREGHRKFYCPELKDRQFKCRLCGKVGHNRRTCPKSRMGNHKGTVTRHHSCTICNQKGHNRRTCPRVTGTELDGTCASKEFLIPGGRNYTCGLCQEKGHNARTCPSRSAKVYLKKQPSSQNSPCSGP